MPGLIVQLKKSGLKWASLFDGSRDEGALEVAPILVQIRCGDKRAAGKTLMNWVFEQGRYSSSILFLCSPLDTSALAQRLAARLDVSLPDGVEMLLRFFDGRIFEALMMVLQAEQKTVFLNPARAWWFVDRVGNVHLCESCFSAVDPPHVLLVLNSAQEAALIDGSEIDQVAMLLGAVMPFEFESMHEVDRVSFLLKNTATARSYNIVSTNDLTMYCAMAMTHGDDFHLDSPWANRFMKIREGSLTMDDAMQND